MLSIIGRIRKSLAGGALREKPPDKTREIKTISDLVQTREDVFPGFGVSDLQEGSLRPHYNFRFRSVPRRSKLPLEPPRTIENPLKPVGPTLFLSVQAVWEYYREIDKADQALLELPFTDQGVGKFVEPLFDVVEDYYPLFDSPFNHHRYLVGRENIKFLDYLKKYKGKSPFYSLPIVGKGASILED
jgi:hypothetical protein